MQAMNSVLNRIHEWSEPEAHLMKRFALTRIATIGLVGLEGLATLEATYDLGKQASLSLKNLVGKGLSIIFPTSRSLQHFANQDCNYQAIGKSLLLICKLIIGLIPTILIGIIFSPEINFRLHLKLGLAVDNLAVRKQKDLAVKLKAEAKAVELGQSRAARFEQFQASQRAAKEAGKPDPIDEHLTELLVPSLSFPIRKA